MNQHGADLFERLCRQPEYYLRCSEEGILATEVSEIERLVRKDATLIDIGSGATRVVHLLLEHMEISSYLGVDTSKDFLLESTGKLAAEYPWLDVYTARTDFSHRITLHRNLGSGQMVGFLPGSRLGIFSPTEAQAFLTGIHATLPKGSSVLVGVDLLKDQLPWRRPTTMRQESRPSST